MQELIAELRQSCRSLLKTPSFSIFVTVALALGIGANTAIFSLVDSLFLQPLQFRDSSRLVEIWENAPGLGFPENTPSPGNFSEWKKRNHVFTDMAALTGDIFALTGDGPPQQLEGSHVSHNLFALLGVEPVLGRNFLPEEDRRGGPRVVIISASLWRQRFGSDPSVVGRTIRLDGQPFQVAGVMPEAFSFPERSSLWTPLRWPDSQLQDFSNHYLRVFARLRPGVSVQAASRELKQLTAQLAVEHPREDTDISALAIPLRDQLVGNLRLGLFVLCASVCCVLLIACANVAGLLLARGFEHRRELAVRAALGATRLHLVKKGLLESLILSFAGGALGLLLSTWALPFVKRLVPLALAGWARPHLDWRLTFFAFSVATVSAVAFGVLPAAKVSKFALEDGLRQQSRTVAGIGNRTRRFLVVGEVTLATALVCGAGLFLRTFWALSHVPLGFQPANLLTVRTNLPWAPYRTLSSRVTFYEQVIERVKAIPGVKSAGYTTFLPLTNGGGTTAFTVEGHPPPAPGQPNDANLRVVSDHYLQTMGVRLRSGRFFDAFDRLESRPVAIINSAMARQYWPGENALDHRVALEKNGPWITIVGIVDPVRQIEIDQEGRAEIYLPVSQTPAVPSYLYPRDLVVRVARDPMQFASAVKRAVWSVDRDQPISDVMPMSRIIEDRLAPRNLQLKLLVGFAALALVLSSLGLYGLLAYTVVQRRREIGIRMALGAQKREVLGAVIADGLKLVSVGLIAGLFCVAIFQSLVSSLFYGVAASDSPTFLVTGATLVLTGLMACYLPARAAASIEPAEALRHE